MNKKIQNDIKEIIAALRPIDDEFMRALFKDNIPLAQFVLRILTGKCDLVITELETQRDLKMLGGYRSVCLDAYGTDAEGKKYNLEIQRGDKGANPYRARYHSSVLDICNLRPGQDFTELPETYIIFITENDIFKEGRAIYSFDRIDADTGRRLKDGTHIIYINGEYRGKDEIGKLMHDFNCADPDEMNFKIMAENVEYFKKDVKGNKQMSGILERKKYEWQEEAMQAGILQGIEQGIEQGIKQGREEKNLNTARKMLADGILPMNKIADYVGLSLEEIENLKKTLLS